MKQKFYSVFFFSLFFLTSSVLFAQDNFWQQAGDSEGSNTHALAYQSSGALYAATEKGLFSSADNGDRWIKQTNGLMDESFYSVAVSPAGVLYAGSATTIYRSTDGAQWINVGQGTVQAKVQAIAFTGSATIYAGTDLGLFRSTNNGFTWNEQNLGLIQPSILSIALHPTGAVYAGIEGDGIYRSTDSGVSWQKVDTELMNPFIRALMITSNGYIFAGTYGGLYRSTDNGTSWSIITTDVFPVQVYALAAAPDGDLFAAIFTWGVLKSTDNGATWKGTIPLNDIALKYLGFSDTYVWTIIIKPNNEMFIGSERGIYSSTNDGFRWIQRTAALETSPILALGCNAQNHIFAGSMIAGIFRSTNQGDSWSLMTRGFSYSISHSIVAAQNGHLFVATDSSIFRSTDNGMNWLNLRNGILNDDINMVTFNSRGFLFACTDTVFNPAHPEWYKPGAMYRSTNDGDLWQRIENGLTNHRVKCIAINILDQIFVGTEDGVFTSTNNGDVWMHIGDELKRDTVLALVIDMKDAMYACTNHSVFKSVNNGLNWTQSNYGLVSKRIRKIAVNFLGELFVATSDSGVYRSTDYGQNWTLLNSGLTTKDIRAIAISNDGYIYAGTTDKGVFRSVKSTTGVNDRSNNISSSFSLEQNYPNPFTTSTTIPLQINSPSSEFVTIKVYDVLGRETKILFEGELSSGNHEIKFDGEGLRSGQYFVNIVSGSKVKIIKVTVLY